MANFGSFKGGRLFSGGHFKGGIFNNRYYRVEFIGESIEDDRWKITLVNRETGNKEVKLNSTRHTQLLLERLKAGDPPTGFHKPGEPPPYF
jgi:hypothetical protein